MDARAAERGVSRRLGFAAMGGVVTLASLVGIFFLAPDKFTFLVLIALCASGLMVTIAFILSARREELVHQLASDLQAEPLGLLEDMASAQEHTALPRALPRPGEVAPMEDARARDGSV